jgi:[acyl-carrier-protein] S-malonyltransferase
MGAELFDARPDLLGASADSVLGWSLRRMCLEGPEESLTRTEYAQPALFALSVALWELVSSSVSVTPVGAAGHSLGEYAALVASGMVTFEDALSVVAERGQAMAEAADLEPQGMAALVGADLPTAEEVCRVRRDQGGRLFVANDNAPGQVVVAGGLDDLDWLDLAARDHGVRRAIRLKVAGAFHSPFMAPAADRVERAVAEMTVVDGRFPVYANVNAAEVSADEVKRSLTEQVVGRVRFAETLRAMSDAGASLFVHVGPGDVTAGMAKRTVAGCNSTAVSGLSGVEALADLVLTSRHSGGV